MRNAIPLLFGLLFAAGLGPAGATEQVVTRLPTEALPISDYFYQGQKVYDRDGNEIADVNDVLIDKKGKVVAVMIGVGGVLGAGEKNIAIDFEALEVTEKEPRTSPGLGPTSINTRFGSRLRVRSGQAPLGPCRNKAH